MVTKVDDLISQFLEGLLEEDITIEKVEALLDQVRICYGFDMVFVMERVNEKKDYVYKFVSFINLSVRENRNMKKQAT